MPRAGCHG
jgi:hypothetical protein